MNDGLEGSSEPDGRWVKTLDGFDCDTDLDVWLVPTGSRTCRFDFGHLPGAGAAMQRGVKDMMRIRLADTPPETLIRDFSRVRTLLACAVEEGVRTVNSFSDVHFLEFESRLVMKSRYLAQQMRDFLLAWRESGVGGLQRCLCDLLDGISPPSHVVGGAVRTMCPRRGALSSGEQERLFHALQEAHTNQMVGQGDYALIVLTASLNLRPLQVALLKAQDIELNGAVPAIEVTRLKQGAGIRPRTLFSRCELDKDLAEILRPVLETSAAWADLNGVSPRDAPVFPTQARTGKDGRPIKRLPGLEGHCFSGAISKRVIGTIDKLGLMADDGSPMRVFPQRVRRTGGTNAAADGQPATVIAHLLGQSSLTAGRAYIQATPEMAERIDAALGGALDSWAAAFLDAPDHGRHRAPRALE